MAEEKFIQIVSVIELIIIIGFVISATIGTITSEEKIEEFKESPVSIKKLMIVLFLAICEICYFIFFLQAVFFGLALVGLLVYFTFFK